MAYLNTFDYTYCFSGISGGKSKPFIDMHTQIDKWTDIDIEKNIIPIWHDESYFNKYQYLNSEKFYYLSQYTCYCEDYQKNKIMKYVAAIKIKNKNRYFDVKAFKNKHHLIYAK